MQPVTVRQRGLKQKRQDGYYCVCDGPIAVERRRTGEEAGSETNTVKIRGKLITDRLSVGFVCVCMYVCVRITVVYEVVNPAGLCSTRCPHVRRADASQVVRCCALWPPVPRRSALTRSTSRISAVPSARVVSRNDLRTCLTVCLLQVEKNILGVIWFIHLFSNKSETLPWLGYKTRHWHTQHKGGPFKPEYGNNFAFMRLRGEISHTVSFVMLLQTNIWGNTTAGTWSWRKRQKNLQFLQIRQQSWLPILIPIIRQRELQTPMAILFHRSCVHTLQFCGRLWAKECRQQLGCSQSSFAILFYSKQFEHLLSTAVEKKDIPASTLSSLNNKYSGHY